MRQFYQWNGLADVPESASNGRRLTADLFTGVGLLLFAFSLGFLPSHPRGSTSGMRVPELLS